MIWRIGLYKFSVLIRSYLSTSLLTTTMVLTAESQEPFLINHNIRSGLPSNTVYFAKQDRDGFMWFGTDAGACRFDGKYYTTFTTEDGLTDNEVFQVHPDSRGRVWFLTFNGRICYLQDNAFHHSLTDSVLAQLDANEIYSCFFEDSRKRIWLGTINKGIFLLDGDVARKISLPPGLPIFHVWQDDRTVFALTNKGVFEFSLETPQSYRFVGYPQLDLSGTDGSRKVGVDLSRHLLLITPRRKGVYTLDYKAGIVRHDVQSLAGMGAHVQSDGSIMIYHDNGIYRWAWEKDYDEKKNILNDYNISHIANDRTGGIWITTLNNGVYYSPDIRIRNYGRNAGLQSQEIAKISGMHNARMVLTYFDGGISWIDSSSVDHLEPLFPKGNFKIEELRVVNDTIWVAVSSKGLVRIARGKINRYFTGLSIKSIDLKNRRLFIAAGSSGLKSFELDWFIERPANTLDYLRYGEWLIRDTRCFSVLCDRNSERVWVGTQEGLVMLDKDGRKNMSSIHPYLQHRISSIFQDHSGCIWFLVDSVGVVIIDGSSSIVAVLDEASGFHEGSPRAVFIDHANVAWIISNNALYQVVADGKAMKLKMILSLKDVVLNDLYVDRSTIWLASSTGVITVPRENTANQEAKVRITDVFVNGKQTAFSLGDKIEIPYNERSVRIKFTRVSFTATEPYFRYTLDLKSPAWSYTRQNEVDLYSLSPGSYNFSIQTRKGDGTWSEGSATISLVVQKPLWQEWWFLVLTVTLAMSVLAFMLYVFYRSRYRKVRMQERLIESELKALTAQMNPHFIFNTLNTVQRFYVTKETVTANKLLSRFSILMRNLLDNTSRSHVSVEDEVAFLRNYLEIEQTRFSNKFNFEIYISPDVDPSRVIPSMIIQPFIENAIIHGLTPKAAGGWLKVEFQQNKNGHMRISIDDNGVGRNHAVNKNHVSKGINLIRDRLNILSIKDKKNYTLQIIDKDGIEPGTRVELIL